MPGLFIAVSINPETCKPACGQCVAVCPVDIFAPSEGHVPRVVQANEDECTLCDLCLDVCPTDAIAIDRLYRTASRARP